MEASGIEVKAETRVSDMQKSEGVDDKDVEDEQKEDIVKEQQVDDAEEDDEL